MLSLRAALTVLPVNSLKKLCCVRCVYFSRAIRQERFRSDWRDDDPQFPFRRGRLRRLGFGVWHGGRKPGLFWLVGFLVALRHDDLPTAVSLLDGLSRRGRIPLLRDWLALRDRRVRYLLDLCSPSVHLQ